MNANSSSPVQSSAVPAQVPTLIASLLENANRHPDAPALCDGEVTISYGRFLEDARRLATRFADLGVQASDRIVLHLGNGHEAALACYASIMLGAIAAPLNVHLKAHELARLIHRLQPAVYIGHLARSAMLDDVPGDLLPVERRFYVARAYGDMPQALHTSHIDRHRHTDGTWDDLMTGARDIRALPPPDADAIAMLLCTSGTTGEPKLVAHTQRSIAHAVGYVKRGGSDSTALAISPTPLFHMPGMLRLCATLSLGQCLVLPSCLDFDAAAYLDAVERHRCTTVSLSPFGAAEFIREQTAHPRATGALRNCIVTGDACSIELQQRFEATFGVPLVVSYGMTEASRFVVPGRTTRTVRTPPGTARIVDPSGHDVAVGTPGELILNAPTLFDGYWISPGVLDRGRDAEGWYHTGDLVREDEHGDLHYVARIKEIIVRDGENISPAEIEQTLLQHPAADDAAVVGVSDELLGERIVGFVKLAAHVTDAAVQDIRMWLATRLADHKLPETLLSVERIPRTSYGKADRRALRELARSALINPG